MITLATRADFEKCRVLSRTVTKYIDSNIEHHIIVDKKDLGTFRPLANRRTRLWTMQDFLPWWLVRLPGSSPWWFSMLTFPVKNHLIQKLVKLSVADRIDADGYIFVEPNVVFIRPLEKDILVRDNRLRLFRNPGAAKHPIHKRWNRTASHLLGLPKRHDFGSNYNDSIVTWRRDNLIDLQERIEWATSRKWQEALCGIGNFDENILYGVFSEFLLQGMDHFPCHESICHHSLLHNLNEFSDFKGFFNQVPESKSSVSISDYQGISPDKYFHLVA